MKHILKKFLSKVEIGPQIKNYMNNATEVADISKINTKDHIILAATNKDELVAMFTLSEGKQKYFLPEPDLVVCLFECGRQYAVQIPDLRRELLYNIADTSKTMSNSHNFYAASCLATTSLLNALEAFINRLIPNNFEYIYEEPQRKIIQNKEQIERNSSFEKKVKEIIPSATGKDFHLKFPKKYTIIFNLKTLRDDMTHLKSYRPDNSLLSYEDVYNRAFKFDYLQALEAVKFYINYYQESLIEPCICGADF